jgi:hypothetical protein
MDPKATNYKPWYIKAEKHLCQYAK